MPSFSFLRGRNPFPDIGTYSHLQSCDPKDSLDGHVGQQTNKLWTPSLSFDPTVYLTQCPWPWHWPSICVQCCVNAPVYECECELVNAKAMKDPGCSTLVALNLDLFIHLLRAKSSFAFSLDKATRSEFEMLYVIPCNYYVIWHRARQALHCWLNQGVSEVSLFPEVNARSDLLLSLFVICYTVLFTAQ